jgi:hypothetical protein
VGGTLPGGQGNEDHDAEPDDRRALDPGVQGLCGATSPEPTFDDPPHRDWHRVRDPIVWRLESQLRLLRDELVPKASRSILRTSAA